MLGSGGTWLLGSPCSPLRWHHGGAGAILAPASAAVDGHLGSLGRCYSRQHFGESFVAELPTLRGALNSS